jgi:hypothetical protein
MKVLGRRSIKNTLLCMQSLDTKEDDYICKITENTKDVVQLIEDGFEYVCDLENLKFLRKRK